LKCEQLAGSFSLGLFPVFNYKGQTHTMVRFPKLYERNQGLQDDMVRQGLATFGEMPEYVRMRRVTEEFYHVAVSWHNMMEGEMVSANEYQDMDNRYMAAIRSVSDVTSEFFAAVILFCVSHHGDNCVESIYDEVYDLSIDCSHEMGNLQQFSETVAVHDPSYLAIIREISRLVAIYERGIGAIYTAIFAVSETEPVPALPIVSTPTIVPVVALPVVIIPAINPIATTFADEIDDIPQCPIHPNCPYDIYFRRLQLLSRGKTKSI